MTKVTKSEQATNGIKQLNSAADASSSLSQVMTMTVASIRFTGNTPIF